MEATKMGTTKKSATKPEPIIPRMVAPKFAEHVSGLPGETPYDPNKSFSVALGALVTAVDELLTDVLIYALKLALVGKGAAQMDARIKRIYTMVEMLNNQPLADEEVQAMLEGLVHAGTKAGSANDETDSDETANEAPQSMTVDNGMDDALQSNEAPAAHDNATSECNLMDGDNHRPKRRKIILRVGSKNSHAAI